MPRLTRFQALIILITVAILILIAAVVFLFLSYQNKVAKEKKVNADIQTVQNLASQNAWTQLEPAKLKSENFAPEAIALAETLASQNAPQVEIAKLKAEIIEIFNQKLATTGEHSTDPHSEIAAAAEKIAAMGDQIILPSVELAKDQDPQRRIYAYTILAQLARNSSADKEKVLPYLVAGLNDPIPDLKIRVAYFLLLMGEKQAVPVFINSLDNQADFISTDPPMYIGYYSAMTLTDFLGVDFDTDQAQWQSWWNANEKNLTWDEKNLKFYQ